MLLTISSFPFGGYKKALNYTMHEEKMNTFSVLNDTTIVSTESTTSKNKISGKGVLRHHYTFSKVFGPDTTQKELFDECVSYQIKDFILGRNCLLFAHGTTNAGKTHTLQGDGSSPGVIPRSLDLLFKNIRGQVSSEGRYKPDNVNRIIQLDSSSIVSELEYKNGILNWNDKPLKPIKSGIASSSCDISGGSESDFISNTFREMQKTLTNDSPIDMSTEGDVVYGVWVSFAGVYNERIYDLLDPIVTVNCNGVPLRSSQDGGDLKMIHVSSGDEAFHVMSYGKANLQVAATNKNMLSSRSHCIFSIKLVRCANAGDPTGAVTSFTFCDLAGAERAKKTSNAGDRLKESNNIISSLNVLGRCLATIKENQKKKKKTKTVPYTGSKLTRILFQRALTGDERITMIVNVNTAPILFDEAVNVLKFSAIAKQRVLVTPIKKSKPVAMKSHLSIMVTKPNHHLTICWDAPLDDQNKSTSSQCSDDNHQNDKALNEELLLLVEKLKQQVTQEKEKNLTLERNIRETMTQYFTKVITDMENSFKTRMRDAEKRSENDATTRIKLLENYYKQQRRQDSNVDDSIVECDSSELTQRIKLLENVNLRVTPVTPAISCTPQSRQDGRTPNAREANPGTPNSSHQFSQEILFAHPSKKTARERLKWIQKKRLFNVIKRQPVENRGKWRYLSDCHDASSVPQKWFCRMHPGHVIEIYLPHSLADEEQKHCDAPERRESLPKEEDILYKYSPGSLVWAKVLGYPWWPAMVDYDPDKKEFYRFEEEKIAEYHVVFFDDYDEPSSRAWLRVEELDKFQDRDLKSVRTNRTKLKSRVTKAYKEACMAEKLTMEDRLLKYSFALTSTMVECKKGKLG